MTAVSRLRMHLHYYRALPNFGDALNPWLWPQLLPGAFEETSSNPSASPASATADTLFLGIGTILQKSVPPAARYIVLGSGCGYGELPALDARWQFLAVRGPLTARALGLSADLAVTDAAYLLRLIDPLPAPRATEPGEPRIGFMPHWRSLRRVPWRAICRRSGLRFLDPFAPVERTLADLRGCECVIAEAMHAAIVADALRVPWVPVRIGGEHLDFKWRDWLASIALDYTPRSLPSMDPWTEHRDRDRRAVKTLRRAVNVFSYYLRSAPLIVRLASLRRDLERGRQPTYLSSDAVVRDRTAHLERCLDALRVPVS